MSGRIQRERAADTGRAAQMNFAAEQVGQFAADGEAQSRTTVFAAGAGICLLERLEDDLLLLQRNADAGIGHFECDHRRRLVEHRVLRAPAARTDEMLSRTPPCAGELERVRQQVLQHLLQPL